MSSEELAVLAANSSFYRAFAAHDVNAMDAQWARRVPVAVVHPGWAPLFGRENVMSSWRGILERGETSIRFERASAHIIGDAAYVVCLEVVSGAALVATNLFVREDNVWKIAHHQATPMSPPQREAPRPKGPLN